MLAKSLSKFPRSTSQSPILFLVHLQGVKERSEHGNHVSDTTWTDIGPVPSLLSPRHDHTLTPWVGDACRWCQVRDPLTGSLCRRVDSHYYRASGRYRTLSLSTASPEVAVGDLQGPGSFFSDSKWNLKFGEQFLSI